MSSRDAILSRIRISLAESGKGDRHLLPEGPAGCLAQKVPVTFSGLPPVPEVWPRENPTVGVMAERFQRELEAVHGEVVRCAGMEVAQRKLAELAAQESWEKIGSLDRSLCRDVCRGLAADRVGWASSDWTPQSMAGLSVGVVEADCLLADTGTSMVACGRAEERLLCYLPPACVIVATADRLVEHLPAAWPQIAPRIADPQVRGEFVFITGPSRTADIEKILILGVHGPKRLIVLLVV